MKQQNHEPTLLYQWGKPAATFAAKRDADYFAKNPTAIWRVRPIYEGESPIIDALVKSGAMPRAYAIVIYHARAGDKRAKAAHGVYPVTCRESDRTKAKLVLRREAKRFVRWFQKSATTPPPTRATAVMI